MPRYRWMRLVRNDLDDEADERELDRDLREEGRDRVRVGRALRFRGRHVELLLDDGRADRGKADDQRDELQLARRAQER